MTTTPNTEPMPPATSAQITPTDAQINRVAAELIGYRWYRMPAWASNTRILKTLYRPEDIEEWPDFGRYLLADGTEETYENDSLPDFCAPDCPHSLTAQLLTKVEAEQAHPAYLNELRAMASPSDMWPEIITLRFNESKASPRTITIAVLRALNAWPDAWELPTC